MPKYFAAAASVAVGAGLLIFPKTVSSMVRDAVMDCLNVVIPSLFSFTAFALWLQNSGIYRYALRFITFPLSKLLRMDEELCAVFVLANIGGFPTGIKLLSELVKNGRIDRNDASRMLCCCFGSGPSFIIGMVGIGIFGSAGAGVILFFACFFSSLLLAAIVRLKGEIKLKKAENHKCNLSSECFVSSVTASAKVMFTVCVMIVGFSAITALLKELGLFELVNRFLLKSDVLAAILEITRVKDIAMTSSALPVCAALLSFGGVCVHLQLSALGGGIPMRRFLLSRLVAMLVSAAFTLPFSRNISQVYVPAAVLPNNTQVSGGCVILSLCVIAMSVILLLEVCVENKKE